MLSETTLHMLNSNALTAVANALTSKLAHILRRASQVNSRLIRLSGQHFERFNATGGVRAHLSPNSGKNSSKDSSNSVATVRATLDAARILSQGMGNVFEPGTVPYNISRDDIEKAHTEIDSIFPSVAANSHVRFGSEIRTLQSNYRSLMADAASTEFLINDVSNILKQRADGILPEPWLNFEGNEIGGVTEEVESIISKYIGLVDESILRPFRENKAKNNAIAAQIKAGKEGPLNQEELVDLSYGPPVSKTGQYILSEDGIYYDVRHGGIPTVETFKIIQSSWSLDADPVAGGKGQILDAEGMKEFSNSIFSDSFTETNALVRTLLKNDAILQAYERDRVIQAEYTQNHIDELIQSGFAEHSVTVRNMRKSLGASVEAYSSKLRKRAKQIQLAGLFGPYQVTSKTFTKGENHILERLPEHEQKSLIEAYKTKGLTLENNNEWFQDGYYFFQDEDINGKITVGVKKMLENIPLNDFSYLRGSSLIPDIDAQRSAVCSEDVQSLVKPVVPRFYNSEGVDRIFLKDFAVDPAGDGEFISYDASGTQGSVSSTSPLVKGIDSGITTDDLLICYNFIKPTSTTPSSTLYNLDNYAKGNTNLDGKIVASSVDYLYPSGLSIPFLRGSLYDAQSKYGLKFAPDPHYPDNCAGGSYVRLPNNWKQGNPFAGSDDLINLMQNPKGWSMDFWTHVPELHIGMTEVHRYRVVAACENTGRGWDDSFDAIGAANEWETQDQTRGMIIGFRDKGVSGLSPSGDVVSWGNGLSATNPIAQTSGLQFVILPTVGQNPPSPSEPHTEYKPWRQSVCIAEKMSVKPSESGRISAAYSPDRELGIHVDLSATTISGKSIGDCSGVFNHYAISFDYHRDTAKVFVDGETLTTCSIAHAFDIPPRTPLDSPSPSRVRGVEYTHQSWQDRTQYGEKLHEGTPQGPANYPIYTPWILGGGWTDGIEETPVLNTTPAGFLGYNTNDYYKRGTTNSMYLDVSGGIVGQHKPSLGGYQEATIGDHINSYQKIPRSGLDGFLGSFKIYSRALDNSEVTKNFKAQKNYFKNIRT